MVTRVGIDIGSDTLKTVIVYEGSKIEELPVLSIQGQPLQRVEEALSEVVKKCPRERVLLGVTGSGALGLCNLLGIEPVDELNALAAAFNLLYPDVRTVIEMGREAQKYLLFDRDELSGRLLIEDSNLGTKCAAGSGSFINHMAKRLNYPSIQAFAEVALRTDNPVSLSGRCGVFTESDIVHLYQKGTPRDRIAAGVHQAICRNYKSNISRGKEFREKVAFIGGVSNNQAVVKYLIKELNLDEKLFIPEYNLTLGAIGAALRTSQEVNLTTALNRLDEHLAIPFEYIGTAPLSLGKSVVMTPPEDTNVPQEIELAALGIDIGSVSTKAVLITELKGQVHVLGSYYRRTDGDPLAAVKDTVGKIHEQIMAKGYRIGKVVAATTGSGRYLTGDYVGADLVKNEITSQAHGARTFVKDVDSIFEIGGQDSKFVRLSRDVIVDFEMNKACAAGTGAFLEKQAARMGIRVEDFGDYTLRGRKPPDLDWTCTVFSESAMVYYQQNNVPIEELCAGVCLASVKNYLNKNVGNRDIGENIAFQGAVAFNKGMIAAFETILRRKIVVPPYPHLTGAIGAARLAYHNQPERSRFRGFEQIAEGHYTVSSFECKGCPNHCDVNTFQIKSGPKYFYNDRCERYSAVHKKNLGVGLPDLFEEHEKLLFEVYQKDAPPGAKKIGIPRGLMFNEYFPLFNAFFTELGFEVVPSDRSNKQIVNRGLESVVAEPCFPLKVAHGHFANLLEKDIDYLFAPGILETEQPNPHFQQSQTCPYLQAAPEIIASALQIEQRGIKYLAPRLFFKRGYRHLKRVFREVARELGKGPKEAERPLQVGLETLTEFRRRIRARGCEVLENLGEDQMAFVVIGRPYTVYDRAVNMDIGKKIQDLGVLAIPMDFVPIEDEDISDSWPNTYARQIQKKLAAARLISKDKRLRGVVLTYFACGPDSFANQFFKDELDEPCYVMQIDEHTADAGVITRIEAFLDTTSIEKMISKKKTIRSNDYPLLELDNRKLWISYACEAAHILAAALRAYGINADVLPRSTDPGMNLARAAIPEDVCLPALMTTEDILLRANQPDFDPKREAFFQGKSQGPCRFGMYHMLQRRILDKLGLEEVPIVTLGNVDHHGGLGTWFSMVAWDGLVAHDMLLKMMLCTRPYEVNKGESEQLFLKYLQEVCELIPEHRKLLESGKINIRGIIGNHLDAFEELLVRAQADFARIERLNERKPLVGVVGEFYVRLHDGANQDIIRKIEKAGGEAWLAPLTEFFGYSNQITQMLAMNRWHDTRAGEDLRIGISRAFLAWLARRDEHKLYLASLPYLADYEDISPKEVILEGSRYVHPSFGGEAICSMGKSEDFAKRGLDGIVSVVPFNCMPGGTVAALGQAFRRNHNNIPFLSIDYDGFIDSSRDAKITSFMWQVKERFWGKLVKNSKAAK